MKTRLEIIGAVIYGCEGSKTHERMIEIINSDYRIINTFMKYLIEIHDVKKEQIVLRLQLTDYHDEEICKNYWREITNHPNAKFQKSQIVKVNTNTKNHKRKEYGLCCLRVNSTMLFREIIKCCDMVLIN